VFRDGATTPRCHLGVAQATPSYFVGGRPSQWVVGHPLALKKIIIIKFKFLYIYIM
jgi:hypothetical protein